MISNPVTQYAGVGNRREFTYEGGTKLFHFSPHDNKLSETLENNVVFFANDEEHALDVLERMFTFMMECALGEEESYTNKRVAHAKEFQTSAGRRYVKFEGYLKALKKGKLKVSEAPTNQFYKVGWASNDTLS